LTTRFPNVEHLEVYQRDSYDYVVDKRWGSLSRFRRAKTIEICAKDRWFPSPSHPGGLSDREKEIARNLLDGWLSCGMERFEKLTCRISGSPGYAFDWKIHRNPASVEKPYNVVIEMNREPTQVQIDYKALV